MEIIQYVLYCGLGGRLGFIRQTHVKVCSAHVKSIPLHHGFYCHDAGYTTSLHSLTLSPPL